MVNEIRDDMLKVKKMVSEVEMIIGKREGESELVNKLIDAENLLTYCMSRLENAIVPPCKVGNVVWLIENHSIERATVNKVEITGTSEFRITLKKLNLVGKYVYFQLEPKELGITIFIGENAKDQAEQKLKEMRGING